ncbi:sensor histidine kinase [Brachybacterium horti]
MTPSSHPAPARPERGRRDPFRWVIDHPGTVDAAVFGAAAVALLGFTLLTGAWGWWLPATLPMLGAAAVCRSRPGLGVALMAAFALLHMPLVPVVLGDALTFYAMFCAIAYGRPLVHALGIVAGVVGALVQSAYWALHALLSGSSSPLEALVTLIGLLLAGTVALVAVWALANLQRARVQQMRLVAERAEQAEREREQRTALAVAGERSRIAREMHDVVAHSLSVIIAQADGGRYVASVRPEQAADVLATIADTGRSALADMRSLLGVLRQDDETSYGPQPGPEMLQELVARVRTAGLDVDLHVDGRLDDLPRSVGTSLFRLVQEALTNTLKHAGPRATAAVRVRRSAGGLEVEVIDDGQGTDPASDGQGHGITGMRERMSVLGGTLQAGPLPGHGFRVLARIPLGAPASTSPSAPTSSPPSSSSSAPAAPSAPPSPNVPPHPERTLP